MHGAPRSPLDVRTPTADEVISSRPDLRFCFVESILAFTRRQRSAISRGRATDSGPRYTGPDSQRDCWRRMTARSSLSPGSASRASYAAPRRVLASSSRWNSWPAGVDSRARYASIAHNGWRCWEWARIERRFAIRGRRSGRNHAPWAVHARGSFRVQVARTAAIHWSSSFANCVPSAMQSINIHRPNHSSTRG